MKTNTILGLLLILVLGGKVWGQQNHISYCDLLENPQDYDGKEVTIRATYRYGFEWQEIFCLSCRNEVRTWLEIDSSILKPKSIKALKKLPKDWGTVTATFTGKFESSDGPFGDGTYRYRFALKEISQITLVAKNSRDPKKFPPKILKKICAR